MVAFAFTPPLAAQDARVSEHVTVVVRPDVMSGKLVRSVVVMPREVAARVHAPLVERETAEASRAAAPLSTNIIEMIDQIAKRYDVEGPLVHSVIRAESNYNARAVSPKGAMGMMQLIPATARRFGVMNPFDPRENIEGGVRYLRFLLDYFKNDYAKVVAAYNAGEGAVDQYRGVPPYAETRNYVTQVALNLRAARQAEELKNKAAQPAATEKASLEGGPDKPAETYHPIRASISEDGRVNYRTQ